jgi:hypothetical protein
MHSEMYTLFVSARRGSCQGRPADAAHQFTGKVSLRSSARTPEQLLMALQDDPRQNAIVIGTTTVPIFFRFDVRTVSQMRSGPLTRSADADGGDG